MLKIRKVLDEFNNNYEGIAAQKIHSNCSDKKRTPDFYGEIQAMNDNDPSKCIRLNAKDMGVSEFLFKQVVHEDIQYLS